MVENEGQDAILKLEELKIENESAKTDASEKKLEKNLELTKKKGKKAEITPEIEEKRRLRQLKKEQKEKSQSKVTEQSDFIKRDILSLSSPDATKLKLKIMSYNMLAQGLIRSKMFPTSGPALKWKWRSKALLDEITYYDCDILFLQELDEDHVCYWKKNFRRLGFTLYFHKSPAKSHGVAVVLKDEYFIFSNQYTIDYDDEVVGKDIGCVTITDNIGTILYVKFTPLLLNQFPYLSERDGLLLGTSHLYWHPNGCYERTRQTYLLLQGFRKFASLIASVNQISKGFYRIFGGDLNSEPFDPPYLSITAKPYNGGSNNLYRSIRQLSDMEAEPIPEDAIVEPTPEEKTAVTSLQSAHRDLKMRAISLYSIGYKQVHPENSNIHNERNEPGFSNWAHAWRGLIDYIFVISDWDDNSDYSSTVDSVEQVQKVQGVKLLGLLRLPTYEEMEPIPSGLPKVGKYPSDHLAIIAEVELHDSPKLEVLLDY